MDRRKELEKIINKFQELIISRFWELENDQFIEKTSFGRCKL